jgi:hypothetical protein
LCSSTNVGDGTCYCLASWRIDLTFRDKCLACKRRITVTRNQKHLPTLTSVLHVFLQGVGENVFRTAFSKRKLHGQINSPRGQTVNSVVLNRNVIVKTCVII